MGLHRGNERIPKISESLEMAVRADRKGTIMVDYQNVGRTVQADGKETDRTLQTWRGYIQDASFYVVLEGDEALLDEISEALRHPVWMPYLGRKSCPVSVPVLAEKKDCSLLEAINDADSFAKRHDDVIYYEITSSAGTWKNDIPVDRVRCLEPKYERRRVQTFKVNY